MKRFVARALVPLLLCSVPGDTKALWPALQLDPSNLLAMMNSREGGLLGGAAALTMFASFWWLTHKRSVRQRTGRELRGTSTDWSTDIVERVPAPKSSREEQLERDKANLRSRVQALEGEVDALSRTGTMLTQKSEEAAREVRQVRNTRDTYSRIIQEQRDTITQLRKQVQNTDTNKDAWMDECLRLEDQMRRKDTDIITLRVVHEQQKAKNKRLAKALLAATNRQNTKIQKQDKRQIKLLQKSLVKQQAIINQSRQRAQGFSAKCMHHCLNTFLCFRNWIRMETSTSANPLQSTTNPALNPKTSNDIWGGEFGQSIF